mmetsp:Transcript_34801/g.91451  ORF Transcript_34801/g.91451 Transcript_34801/m.91451 type:complete len:123 (-) Transcript_34801:577-945(-)
MRPHDTHDTDKTTRVGAPLGAGGSVIPSLDARLIDAHDAGASRLHLQTSIYSMPLCHRHSASPLAVLIAEYSLLCAGGAAQLATGTRWGASRDIEPSCLLRPSSPSPSTAGSGTAMPSEAAI